ncbi:MAG: type II toxin-antitoxin system RelE/ParE family toxin [Ignavibacteria bacterium]|nr:type II toxin-antitoxin system RelE/ParE family toxin [Ignavibacteria bacterium]
MKIIETPIFTRKLKDTLDEGEYRELQNHLIANPFSGKVIPHSGGLRKLRWSGSGRGKRGGSRIIYYWYSVKEIILMLLIYPKNIQDDLTSEQLKTLKKLVEEEIK